MNYEDLRTTREAIKDAKERGLELDSEERHALWVLGTNGLPVESLVLEDPTE